jgi:Ca2+-binding RTX toxin-like protein
LGIQENCVVAALIDGGYVVAWLDYSQGISTVDFARYNALGVRVQSGGTFDGTYTDPHIAALADGGFVIGYVEVDAVQSRAVISKFGALNNGQLISVSYAPDFFGVAHATVTAVGSGYMLGITNPSNIGSPTENNDNFVLNYDSTGAHVSTDLVLQSNVEQYQIDLDTNRFTGKVVAVYTNRDVTNGISNILIEFADASNAAFSGSPKLVSFTGNSVEPNVTWIGADRVGVVYRNPSLDTISYALLDANGDLVFDNVIPSVLPIGYAKIVDLKNGTFAIVYMQTGAGPDISNDVIIRQYDRNGVQIGTEVTVNSNSQDNAVPDIAALADGRLIVTWTHDGTAGDGSGTSIMQQILDPRDGIINGTNIASVAETLVGNDVLSDLMRGFAGIDTMYGLAGGDVMYGGDGVDTLYGGRGDDTLYGETGNDYLQGGLGADDISGGLGSDSVNYSQSRGGVSVNLLTGMGFGGDAEGDTIDTVESFIGSNFNDVFVGGNAASRIDGLLGDDTLTGGSSLDSFFGGVGADTMNGLGGVDRAFYAGAAVNINLVSNINTGGEAQGDKLYNIEEISGSAQGDTIIGNSLNNRFFGQNGNDVLAGGTGADVLLGGAGSDSFVFNPGDSGQTATTLDNIQDFAIGAVGVGDEIDFSSALSIGGTAAAASANEASINASTGVASFAAGSGVTLADALNDIAVNMTTGGNAVGEFAFFRVNNTGFYYMFMSDGVAGVGANDVLVQLPNFASTIASISIDAGDVTILA